MKRVLTASRTTGTRELRAWLDGKQLDPRPSQQVWNHSPDGFNIGYGGSGPAQLSLAIMLACGLEENLAVALHQPFKWAFLANERDQDGDVMITFDLEEWMKDQDAAADLAEKKPESDPGPGL